MRATSAFSGNIHRHPARGFVGKKKAVARAAPSGRRSLSVMRVP
jgi:hypothetical protein